MSTRKIEQLDEQTILGDNDLVFTSVSNGSGYDSKKVTLASIANYVKSTLGGSGGNSGSCGCSSPCTCGYEIYDTSEPGNGRCESQADVDTYCADNSRNLLFDLPMYASSGVQYADWTVKSFEKTVSKNCVVEFNTWTNLTHEIRTSGMTSTTYAGDFYDNPISSSYSVYIDDKLLRLQNFLVSDEGVKLYLKAGQTIKINVPNTSGGGKVSIIPLKSGWKFFIDTDKDNSYFQHGYMSDLRDTSAANYTYTYTNNFDCPILFCSRFQDSFTNFDDRSSDTGDVFVLLNDKYIHYDSPNSVGDSSGFAGAANGRIILMPGDTFKVVRNSTGLSRSEVWKYNVYPLLTNNSDGGMGHIDSPIDPEPIVVEDEPGQTDEPVSTTKASIAGAATCTTNASSNSTSLTLGITQKTPENASLQYAISATKTPVPTSWKNASVTNNKLTLSISFTAATTQTKYLFIKVSGDGYEDSTYYVGIRQAYSETSTSSTTYSTKTQQIIASSIGAARSQRNTLVAAHSEWVSPSDVYGSHNVWYFTYKVPNTTSTTTGTYGHSISEPLTLVS